MKNLMIAETYTDKQGNEKTSWNKIGIMFEGANGKTYIKLSHIPNQLIHVFEQTEKSKPVDEPVDDSFDFGAE